jgi:ZIP family zinc transporter
MGPDGKAASASLRRIWLFVIAITLHNFPEGLAVGVRLWGPRHRQRHDAGHRDRTAELSEGLAVGVALLGQKYSRMRAFRVALLTGLVSADRRPDRHHRGDLFRSRSCRGDWPSRQAP